MKICMIGAGYVGLVSAACFADFGWNVDCVDKDVDRVRKLNQGIIPIYEPGLDELVERNVSAGRIRFTATLPQAVREADVIFLAVGTPVRRGDGYADLSYVYEAVEELAPHLRDGAVITTNRPSRLERAGRSSAGSDPCDPTSICMCAPTPNSYEKGQRSATLRIQIVCSLVATATGGGRRWNGFMSPWRSATRHWCLSAENQQSSRNTRPTLFWR